MVGLRRTFALLIVAALGCAAEDTDIRARCEVVSTALLGETPDYFMAATFSDGRVLVVDGDIEPSVTIGDSVAEWTGRVYDEDFAPVGEPIGLGRGNYILPSRWASDGERAIALIPSDPTAPEMPGEPEDTLHWYSVGRDGGLEVTPVSARFSRPACDGCGVFGAGDAFLASAGKSVPSVMLGGDGHAFYSAITAECGGPDAGVGNYTRLFAFDTVTNAARRIAWVPETCELFEGDSYATHVSAATDGDSPLLLFRTRIGLADGTPSRRLMFLRLEPDAMGQLQPVGTPHRVGAEEPIGGEGFLQPPMAVLGDRVLFGDRYARRNHCRYLRVMNTDGSGSRRAPWQLPCASSETITSILELTSISDDLALAVWDERPPSDEEAPRAFAALLTPQGRRASEVLQLGALDRGRALGLVLPMLTATSIGDQSAVAVLATASGVRASRIVCEPTEPE